LQLQQEKTKLINPKLKQTFSQYETTKSN